MNKWFSIFITLLIAVFGLATLALKSNATTNYNVDGKVTICHGNSDAKNPYITETPDADGDVSGHDDHNGPVATSLAVAQTLKDAHTQWGDIIPPFTYYYCTDAGYHLDGTVCTKNNHPDVAAASGNYPGKNWTADGQTIWNNNCGYPTVTVTPTVTPVQCNSDHACPTATPTPTVAPTDTPTPNNGGGNPGGDGKSDGLSSCPSCTQAPSSHSQAVLGASTMAGTGTFDTTVMNLMFTFGTMVLGAGAASYAKEKRA